MPGRPVDALVPSGGQGQGQCSVYSVQHGLLTHPPGRISISVRWARGNCLRIAYFNKLPSCEEEEASEIISQQGTSGKVLELRLGSTEAEDAEKRRLLYASAPAFALLQSQKQLMMTSKDLISLDW